MRFSSLDVPSVEASSTTITSSLSLGYLLFRMEFRSLVAFSFLLYVGITIETKGLLFIRYLLTGCSGGAKLMVFCVPIIILNKDIENRLTIMTVEYELAIFLIQIPNLISIPIQKKPLYALNIVFITI